MRLPESPTSSLNSAMMTWIGGGQVTHERLSTRTFLLPSRPPSTHAPWSGRGSWRPGGARHCTNDLDAMGRVCSALPGSMADGMGAHHARHDVPADGNGAPPTRCRPIPRRRHVLDRWPRTSGARLMASGSIHSGRASAQPGRTKPKAAVIQLHSHEGNVKILRVSTAERVLKRVVSSVRSSPRSQRNQPCWP